MPKFYMSRGSGASASFAILRSATNKQVKQANECQSGAAYIYVDLEGGESEAFVHGMLALAGSLDWKLKKGTSLTVSRAKEFYNRFLSVLDDDLKAEIEQYGRELMALQQQRRKANKQLDKILKTT